MPNPFHSSRFYHPTILGEEYKSFSSSLSHSVIEQINKEEYRVLEQTIRYPFFRIRMILIEHLQPMGGTG